LIAADFLTSDYDITFGGSADAYVRRGKKDRYKSISACCRQTPSTTSSSSAGRTISAFCEADSFHQRAQDCLLQVERHSADAGLRAPALRDENAHQLAVRMRQRLP
jgi:hypothetical protein